MVDRISSLAVVIATVLSFGKGHPRFHLGVGTHRLVEEVPSRFCSSSSSDAVYVCGVACLSQSHPAFLVAVWQSLRTPTAIKTKQIEGKIKLML